MKHILTKKGKRIIKRLLTGKYSKSGFQVWWLASEGWAWYSFIPLWTNHSGVKEKGPNVFQGTTRPNRNPYSYVKTKSTSGVINDTKEKVKGTHLERPGGVINDTLFQCSPKQKYFCRNYLKWFPHHATIKGIRVNILK